MINDSRPCSCEGSNPDCFRCNGTGMIPQKAYSNAGHSENSEIAKYIAGNIGKRSPGRIAPRKMVKQTKVKGTVKRLPGEIYVCCLTCKVELKAKRIDRHFQKVHVDGTKKAPVKQNAPKKSTPAKRKIEVPALTNYKAISKISDGFIRCPLCELLISKNRYTDHKERHAQKRMERSVVQTRPTHVKGHPAARPPSVNHQQYAGTSKHYDATFGGHTIRDNGRFGSYPSHDNYDDESQA